MGFSKKAKTLAVVLTGGVLIFSGSVYAATGSNTVATVATATRQFATRMFNTTSSTSSAITDRATLEAQEATDFKAQLTAAVAANVITQAESDSIYTFFTNAEANEATTGAGIKGKTDIFTDLVSNNVITQAKATALRAFFNSQGEAQELTDTKTRLTAYVTDGTITQAQFDKIVTAFTALESQEQAAMANGTFTPGSQTAFLAALVSNGTITQAQSDKIATVFERGGRPPMGGGNGFEGGKGGRGMKGGRGGHGGSGQAPFGDSTTKAGVTATANSNPTVNG
jgi:hypothetical protein